MTHHPTTTATCSSPPLCHDLLASNLTTQMGNHLKLTAFLHAAQSPPQLSGTLSQTDIHLNQWRAQLTSRGVMSKAPLGWNCIESPRDDERQKVLTQQAAVQTFM